MRINNRFYSFDHHGIYSGFAHKTLPIIIFKRNKNTRSKENYFIYYSKHCPVKDKEKYNPLRLIRLATSKKAPEILPSDDYLNLLLLALYNDI